MWTIICKWIEMFPFYFIRKMEVPSPQWHFPSFIQMGVIQRPYSVPDDNQCPNRESKAAPSGFKSRALPLGQGLPNFLDHINLLRTHFLADHPNVEWNILRTLKGLIQLLYFFLNKNNIKSLPRKSRVLCKNKIPWPWKRRRGTRNIFRDYW